MVAVGRVRGLGLDLGPLLVVEAHPHRLGGGGVALDDERLLDQVVALVGVAAQLLERVLAEGQRCQTVVDFGDGAVLAEGEPHARLGVHVRGVDCPDAQQPVVAVGVGAVLVPGGRRGDVAVLVGHDNMGLARRLVGHLEGDLQGLVGVLGHLRYLEIVADDLVEKLERGAARGGFYDGAVLANLERLGGSVGQQVRVVALGLLDGVGAVGQRVGGGLRGIGARLLVPRGGHGGHRLAGIEPLAADQHLGRRLVGYGEIDVGERGTAAPRTVGVAAQGLGLAELPVGLRDLHAAAGDVVLAGAARQVDDLAVPLDIRRLRPVRGEVPLGGLRLDDLVGAARQVARSGGGHVRLRRGIPLCLDGFHDLAVAVGPPVDQRALSGGVDDVEPRPGEAGVALGRAACLRVFLGDLEASRLPGEAHEHLRRGAGLHREGLEARGHLVRAVLHLGPGVAEELVLGPLLELRVGPVSRLAARALVGERQQHVARHQVLVLAPTRAVVPPFREHGLVEARRAVAEPHRGGQVAVGDVRLRVGPRRGRARRGFGAVGHLAVGPHARREVAGVGDVVADGHLDGLGGLRLHGRRCAHADEQSHAHHDPNDLRQGGGLCRSRCHGRLLRTGYRRAPGPAGAAGRPARGRARRGWPHRPGRGGFAASRRRGSPAAAGPRRGGPAPA